MPVPDVTDYIAPHLESIAALWEDRINLGAEPTDDTTTIHIGAGVQFVIDNCCPSIGWVQFTSIYPSTSFPAQDTTADNCPSNFFGVTVDVGVARCTTHETRRGATDYAALAVDAAQQTRDVVALNQLVNCDLPAYFASLNPRQRIYGAPVTPLTIQGKCMGASTEVTFSVGGCCDEIPE